MKSKTKVRKHSGPITGEGMTARVCRFMDEMALVGDWVTPHDVIRATGCTAPTTFFSDINDRLPCNLKIRKIYDKTRECYMYKICRMGEK